MKIRNFAIALNDLRIIPRIIVVAYFTVLVWILYWFTQQADISGAQSAVLTALIGAAGVFTAIYTKSGGIHQEMDG